MMADQDMIRIEAAQWLLLLAEQPGDEALQDRFDAWLDAHPAHVRVWARMTDTDAAIVESGEHLSSTSFVSTSASPVHTRRRDRRNAGRWRPARVPFHWVAGAIAAALATIMVAPTLLLHMRADHVTSAGVMRHVTLPDGSNIDLGPSSAIAIDYEGGRRDIRLLAGQAWFKVAHNPARPFRVTTGDVTATVLGTAFDMRRIGTRTSVEVEHGRVRVNQTGHTEAQSPILTAGQWIRFSPGQASINGREQAGLVGVWRNGELMAREDSIADLIEELRPWYRGRILLLDRTIGQKRVSGFYDARNPVEALRTIVHPHGGSITLITPWLLVVSS